MKVTALLLAMFLYYGLKDVKAQDVVEISSVEREAVSRELDKEAAIPNYSDKIRNLFNTLSEAAKAPKDEKFFKKMARGFGKGSAWLATTTAKPFMTASGFATGVVEKKETNKELIGLYKFLLKHEQECDDLYRSVGTPEEFADAMITTVEDILKKKMNIIMKDFFAHLGLKKPEGDFHLSAADLARVDQTKIDVSFINSHPEYQDLLPIVGEMKQDELQAILSSGHLDRSVSFETYKDALPRYHEMAGTIMGQIFIPKIALGVISRSLVGLYSTPVVIADAAIGISVAICSQAEVKEKFSTDEELRNFCSYVTNRTAYQLTKSRAKGYIAGKKTREKIDQRLEERRARKEQQKKQKDLLM
jgi:hypothetical protein